MGHSTKKVPRGWKSHVEGWRGDLTTTAQEMRTAGPGGGRHLCRENPGRPLREVNSPGLGWGGQGPLKQTLWGCFSGQRGIPTSDHTSPDSSEGTWRQWWQTIQSRLSSQPTIQKQPRE